MCDVTRYVLNIPDTFVWTWSGLVAVSNEYLSWTGDDGTYVCDCSVGGRISPLRWIEQLIFMRQYRVLCSVFASISTSLWWAAVLCWNERSEEQRMEKHPIQRNIPSTRISVCLAIAQFRHSYFWCCLSKKVHSCSAFVSCNLEVTLHPRMSSQWSRRAHIIQVDWRIHFGSHVVKRKRPNICFNFKHIENWFIFSSLRIIDGSARAAPICILRIAFLYWSHEGDSAIVTRCATTGPSPSISPIECREHLSGCTCCRRYRTQRRTHVWPVGMQPTCKQIEDFALRKCVFSKSRKYIHNRDRVATEASNIECTNRLVEIEMPDERKCMHNRTYSAVNTHTDALVQSKRGDRITVSITEVDGAATPIARQ